MSDGFIINVGGIKHSPGARADVCAEGAITAPDFTAKARVTGFAENLGGGLFVFEGLVTGTADVCCARCLEPVALPLEAELEFRFAGRGEADAETPLLSGDSLDITNIVSGTLRADIPFSVLCKENCAGLCQMCGHNLNEGGCGCVKELINPVLKPTDLL